MVARAERFGSTHGERIARLEEWRDAHEEWKDGLHTRLTGIDGKLDKFGTILIWLEGINWLAVKIVAMLFGGVTLAATVIAAAAGLVRIFTGH
jgi:hypothetical protein